MCWVDNIFPNEKYPEDECFEFYFNKYNEKYGETNVLYTAEFNGVNKSGTPTSCKVDHSVWYVDAQGYGARAKLVEKYRLGGISEWEIGYGDNLAIEEVKKIAISMGQDKVVGEVSRGLGEAMVGINVADIPVPHRLAERGW